jgi:nitronate monooxygenase
MPVASFTFGCPSAEQVRRLHEAGCAVLGTATSVAEALALECAGVDAVVAQGADAGGHRGSWLHGASLVGTFSLVPQVASAVRIPVIAAGGIMDGRGVAAALCLGATAAALGTAFIAAAESQAPRIYKDAVLAAEEGDTIITDVFTGRSARGLANKFVLEYDPHGSAANNNRHRVGQQQHNVLPYPYQQFLTNRIKKAASDKQLVAMWCGQGVGLASQRKVADIVNDINEHLRRLGMDLPAHRRHELT